jgi:hypothetical protein
MGGGVVPDPPHPAVAAASPSIRSVEASQNVASDWNLRMRTTLLFAPHEVKTNRGQTTQFTSYNEAFACFALWRSQVYFPAYFCFDGDGKSRFR